MHRKSTSEVLKLKSSFKNSFKLNKKWVLASISRDLTTGLRLKPVFICPEDVPFVVMQNKQQISKLGSPFFSSTLKIKMLMWSLYEFEWQNSG